MTSERRESFDYDLTVHLDLEGFPNGSVVWSDAFINIRYSSIRYSTIYSCLLISALAAVSMRNCQVRARRWVCSAQRGCHSVPQGQDREQVKQIVDVLCYRDQLQASLWG